MHELNMVCKQTNDEVELLSARGDAIQRIDPISSFNAWNIAVACGHDS